MASISSVPGYKHLASAGEMGYLAVNAASAAVTPPYSWGRDFVVECLPEHPSLPRARRSSR